MPYRAEEDGNTSVLLITSRETRRWVVPKGNLIAGLEPYLAAAHEAFEEAGVSGHPAHESIGFYRYAKRRKNGILRTLTVDVFPLAVTAQADDWPEQDERETRWFTPSDAAYAVEEDELKTILLGFRAPPPPAGRPARRAAAGGGTGIIGWFQSLLPSQGRFFELFEAHAALLVAAAEALARMLNGGDGIDAHVRDIMVREQQADDVARDVLQDVRRIFVTPFDRGAITGLIGAMDDAIDQMHQTAKAIALFEVRSFEPQMRSLSGIIVEAARTIAEAIPLLRSVAGNAERLNALTARVVEHEGDAEEINDAGIRDLFRACQGEPMRFVVGQEIYGHLERILDRFEDVANEVQGLVIDHA